MEKHAVTPHLIHTESGPSREVLHFNATEHPTTEWIVQQLREAFPYGDVPRYLILDRDAKFGPQVIRAVKAMGIEPKRTAYQSPWQNGVAERWVRSVREELLDHVIVLDEEHLVRLVREYVTCYHDDRPHLALAKDTPRDRPAQVPSLATNERIVSLPRVGGLHHRYEWRAAA